MQHYLDSSQVDNFDKYLLGGKGYALAKMQSLNLPVPKAFIVTTDYCKDFYKNKKETVLKLIDEINQLNDHFKDDLVSVRSGAPVSMPGMMDTILNVGIDNDSYLDFCKKMGKTVVDDCYKQFIVSFCKSVFNEEVHEENLAKTKEKFIGILKKNNLNISDHDFPLNRHEQIIMSVLAVFNSWMSPRAQAYRQLRNIDESMGTAVMIQKMVFGNLNEKSATGVVFTRDTRTGEKTIMGEFVWSAQGEAIVSGEVTPQNITDLEKFMPKVYQQLTKILQELEDTEKDVQDVEFTIENGKLYILQTRRASRTSEANLKINLDFYREKKISIKELLSRIEIYDLQIDGRQVRKEEDKILAKGLAASPGIVEGEIVLDPKNIKKYNNPILVRKLTRPEDIEYMKESAAIVTEIGGATSHAAVVARSFNKPAIVGIGKHSFKEGDKVIFDGKEGIIYNQNAQIIIDNHSKKEFANLLKELAHEQYKITEEANQEEIIDVSRNSWIYRFFDASPITPENNKNFVLSINKFGAVLIEAVKNNKHQEIENLIKKNYLPELIK